MSSSFCPINDVENRKLKDFEYEVIDRLFVLNAKRAEEERLRGLGTAGNKASKKSTASSKKSPKTPAAAKEKTPKAK